MRARSSRWSLQRVPHGVGEVVLARGAGRRRRGALARGASSRRRRVRRAPARRRPRPRPARAARWVWCSSSYAQPRRWATRRITSSVSRRGSRPPGISRPAKCSQPRNRRRWRPRVRNRLGGPVPLTRPETALTTQPIDTDLAAAARRDARRGPRGGVGHGRRVGLRRGQLDVLGARRLEGGLDVAPHHQLDHGLDRHAGREGRSHPPRRHDEPLASLDASLQRADAGLERRDGGDASGCRAAGGRPRWRSRGWSCPCRARRSRRRRRARRSAGAPGAACCRGPRPPPWTRCTRP